MNATIKIDRFVESLATVRDEDLVGATTTYDARALLAQIIETVPQPRRRQRPERRRLFAGVGALSAAAATAVAVAVALGGGSAPDAAAATVLERAAHAAAREQQLVPGPGQYLYTKSVDAYLDTVVAGGATYSAVIPHVREVWLGTDGGRLVESSGTPVFLSSEDRQAWIAAGRPKLGDAPDSETVLSPAKPLDLPAEPDALYERLQAEAQGHGSSLNTEMFVLVGDALRETAATPAQKAALYMVAARIPGVHLLGRVKDAQGREGTAVAIDDNANHESQTLVFDPKTGTLLDEEELVLAGNWAGYPAGTRIGYASYLEQAVVNSEKVRPSH